MQRDRKLLTTFVTILCLSVTGSTSSPADVSNSLLIKRIHRDLWVHSNQQQCRPDPRSHHLTRRALCPFEIQRDTNPHRLPDVILRAHCHCEDSPCSQQPAHQQHPPGRCISLISPLKVAYLDPQLRFVVSTEVVHVPVACICATQPPGRHMPINRNIVVWSALLFYSPLIFPAFF